MTLSSLTRFAGRGWWPASLEYLGSAWYVDYCEEALDERIVEALIFRAMVEALPCNCHLKRLANEGDHAFGVWHGPRQHYIDGAGRDGWATALEALAAFHDIFDADGSNREALAAWHDGQVRAAVYLGGGTVHVRDADQPLPVATIVSTISPDLEVGIDPGAPEGDRTAGHDLDAAHAVATRFDQRVMARQARLSQRDLEDDADLATHAEAAD